jgi:hypothetical protein
MVMTELTPSHALPSSPDSDRSVRERADIRIAQLDDEARIAASADLVGGVRPASRAEAELMVVRAQRDQLVARNERLRSKLRPMQLVVQALAAIAWRQVGREVIVTDEEIDAAGTRPIEFKRTGPGAVPGWIADTMPDATKDLSYMLKPGRS